MTEHAPEVLRLTAFTVDGTGGNPAGVVLDARELTATDRLAIAADLGYSETAFLETDADGGYRIRYFSPLGEVPFCGHATIATGVALAQRDGVGSLVLQSAVGPIPMHTRRDGQTVIATMISVATHTRPATAAESAELLRALRLDPTELDPRYPLHIAFGGNDHPIVALADRSRLAALDYDYPALAELMARANWITVDVIWAESPTTFHVRNPFPPGGIVEDPATGAAAAAFGGYLRSLQLVPVPSQITVLQGEDMGRPCRLLVELVAGQHGVLVSGSASVIQ